VARKVAAAAGKLVASVPGNALSGDWLDGYAATLKVLARSIDLAGAEPQPGTVAVVGYLMDRNEGDHRGNLHEMERLLGQLGLRSASIWLSGGGVAELARVREAAAIVSLPYGREAARLLGERLSVPVIDVDLQLGLTGAERWLRAVAAATGRAGEVSTVVDTELSRAVPLVDWAVPYHLLHRALVFVGDPHLGLAWEEVAAEVGMRVERHFVLGRRAHAVRLLERCGADRVVVDPKRTTLDRGVLALVTEGRCHMIVGCSLGLPPGPQPAALVELGYPSFFTHALEERPFLFFRGFVNLVERMVNELRRAELIAHDGRRR
jgi:nitrogenase molybdenum-iron protein alpha/beta subunit